MTASNRTIPRRIPRTVPPMAPPVRFAVALAAGLAVLLAATLGVLLSGPPALRAEPNYFEQRKIEAQALETFRRVITLWQEEVYFELYDHGMQSSQQRITREEFAQRMVELSFVPEGELNPTHLKAQFRFRTVVYVTARVPYRHKFNPDQRFVKEQSLLLLWENGQWKVDLVALIRAPFSGA